MSGAPDNEQGQLQNSEKRLGAVLRMARAELLQY